MDTHNVEEMIATFYRAKYGDEGKKILFTETNPPEIHLDEAMTKEICKRINPMKSNGYDYVPLSLIKQEGA